MNPVSSSKYSAATSAEAAPYVSTICGIASRKALRTTSGLPPRTSFHSARTADLALFDNVFCARLAAFTWAIVATLNLARLISRQSGEKILRTHTLSLGLKPGDLAPSKTSHLQADLRLSEPRNDLRTLHKRVSLSSG